MALSDLVTVTFSLTNPGVTQAGFGVPLIASPNAAWVERTRTYNSIDAVAADWGPATPEYLAAQVMFEQDTGLTSLMIGRCANKPTQSFTVGAVVATANAVYALRVAADNGSGVFTSQECDYTATGATQWTINTAYTQGQLVVNDSGPLKFYICITSGTSAGSGGPTGTAADITDNTAHWMYAGAGTLGATTNDAIVYGLKLLVDALAAPVLAVTTSLSGSVGSKTFHFVANTAGAFFGCEALSLDKLSTLQDHADPGITADLTAIKKASSAWYGLVTLYNSSAVILAAAAWAESNTKLYIADTSDSVVSTQAVGVGSDVAQSLRTAAYARTAPFFHPANDDFAGPAEVARWFPIDPGGDNWRLKTLHGVDAKTYSDTQTANLAAKYCNWYAADLGTPVVEGNGQVSANEYIDVIRFRDWYTARLQERCANAMIQQEKIPFTEAGIAVFETIIKGLNAEGVANGGIAPNTDATPIKVIVPSLASIAAADKQARWLKGVKSTWTLAGAINKLSVTVTAAA